MIQIAYVSSSCGLLSPDAIASILTVSREKNRRLGVTGMLLYKDGNVLQVLEGEAEQVLPLYDVICGDTRHTGVLKLYQRTITERDFPEWSMGFQDLNAEELRGMDGFSEFLDPKFDMSTIKPSAAARLLSAFKGNMR